MKGVLFLFILILTIEGRVKSDMPIPHDEVKNAISYICEFLKDYEQAQIISEDDFPVCFPVFASFTNNDVQMAYKLVRKDLIDCNISYRITYQTLYDFRQLSSPQSGYDNTFCIPLNDVNSVINHLNCIK
jgi:hypothetical protein